MTYYLFIDDLRDPDFRECVASGVDPALPWVVARTAAEAQQVVTDTGMPLRLALDHDLGDEGGIVPDFLSWLAREYWNGTDPVPEYTIHSQNPAGRETMRCFMDSWHRSVAPG